MPRFHLQKLQLQHKAMGDFEPVCLGALGSSTLKKGMTGSDVKELQQWLIDAGYSVSGGADGVFGTGTYNAVIQFQKDNGLTADGVVGPQTYSAMGVIKTPVTQPVVATPVTLSTPSVAPISAVKSTVSVPATRSLVPSSSKAWVKPTIVGGASLAVLGLVVYMIRRRQMALA